jgi:hypothetical protein
VLRLASGRSAAPIGPLATVGGHLPRQAPPRPEDRHQVDRGRIDARQIESIASIAVLVDRVRDTAHAAAVKPDQSGPAATLRPDVRRLRRRPSRPPFCAP